MPDILCPTCGAALTLGSRQWLCPKGHCFDVARQGYVNLLPVTQKSIPSILATPGSK